MADQTDQLDTQGFVNPELERIAMRKRLALAMLQQAGDTSALQSPWQALSRAVSPLVGALTLRKANEEYGNLAQGATPELAALSQSDNPLALAAASKNPLIQALIPQLAQMQVAQGFRARGAGAEESAVGKARLGYLPQINESELQQRLQYEPQIAAASANATIPAEVAKEKAILPLEIEKLRASQAPEWANLGERTREFNTQYGNGLFGDTSGFGSTSDSSMPTITTKADFDKLPSGTLYKEADGKTYRKP